MMTWRDTAEIQWDITLNKVWGLSWETVDTEAAEAETCWAVKLQKIGSSISHNATQQQVFKLHMPSL